MSEVFDDSQKQRLSRNPAEAMHGIPDFNIERQMMSLEAVRSDYAAGVREALSQVSKEQETIETQNDMDRMVFTDAAE